MEQQVLDLLKATQVSNTRTIKSAEQSLSTLYSQQGFPFALLAIAHYSGSQSADRKAALTTLRNYVAATWSPSLDETFAGVVVLDDSAKSNVRQQILELCVSTDLSIEANVQTIAASVVSKIASVDFPEQWPTLLPDLINTINNSSADSAVHGALRVLLELVDSGLNEEQFFTTARDLVNALQHIATTDTYGSIVQAMAINVLRSCFEMLEQVLETEHAPAVKAFLDESMKIWIAFFFHTLRQPLPGVSAADLQNGDIMIQKWKGIIALKTQVVKMLEKVKRVYVASITPHVVDFFQTIWDDLSRFAPAYIQLFVDSNGESKLTDSDGLPYTLDALILEELDFLQSALKAKGVRNGFQQQIKQSGGAPHTASWIQELCRLLVLYSRIPQEEAEIWNIDANIYLCETTSVTANYTPRAACADLVVRSLMEWLKQVPIQALLYFSQHSLSGAEVGWREREGVLFLLSQILKDLDDTQDTLDFQTATAILQHASVHLEDSNDFLRAGSQLCLGALAKVAPTNFQESSLLSMAIALKMVTEDSSEVVSVCCISALSQYLEVLPHSMTGPLQSTIINTLSEFLSSRNLAEDYDDADDIKSAIIVALRDAIMLDTTAVEQGPGMNIFFDLASDAAANFMLSEMMVESFESIVSRVAEHGNDAYIRLCEKTIPSLTGAFHIADMRQESDLTNLAAELVSALAEFGFDPLPDGFVSAVMPQLERVLMEGTEASLIRPATTAVTHMLNKGTTQYLSWTSPNGNKSSIEVTLIIINRLLNSPDIEESTADQVGHLASSLVDKCGAEKLGDYLAELLRAVAIRLSTAERAAFIQSLLMVFASLSVKVPGDVVNFLSEININGGNGFAVVLTKWLENSIHFAGFDEIRQNVVALSKIYSLHDDRVKSIEVKGELIIESTGRIKTRSQARLNPDRWTSIPADLKILKLLIDELKNAATSKFSDLGASRAAADALDDDAASLGSDDDGDGDGDDWEDIGGHDGSLDLGSERVRNELMGLVGEDGVAPGYNAVGSRARDDETADYLINWFRAEGTSERFGESFAMLSGDEQAKLRELVG